MRAITPSRKAADNSASSAIRAKSISNCSDGILNALLPSSNASLKVIIRLHFARVAFRSEDATSMPERKSFSISFISAPKSPCPGVLKNSSVFCCRVRRRISASSSVGMRAHSIEPSAFSLNGGTKLPRVVYRFFSASRPPGVRRTASSIMSWSSGTSWFWLKILLYASVSAFLKSLSLARTARSTLDSVPGANPSLSAAWPSRRRLSARSGITRRISASVIPPRDIRSRNANCIDLLSAIISPRATRATISSTVSPVCSANRRISFSTALAPRPPVTRRILSSILSSNALPAFSP